MSLILNSTAPKSADALDLDRVAEYFAALTLEAGAAVMQVYAGEVHAREKADHSPVCDADEQAEEVILRSLRAELPEIPVLAEEAASRGERPMCGKAFILVDPLDGTREFIGRNGEFTVNIALIMDGVPRAGAVFAPALGRLWFAGKNAFACAADPGGKLPPRGQWQAISCRTAPSKGLVALASRSHSDAETEAFLSRLQIAERRSAGSSLKFCALAEGEADVYPRFGPTMEWDTAAGDAVLRAAGGLVLNSQGAPLLYGKMDAQYRNGAFVAWGDPQGAAATLKA